MRNVLHFGSIALAAAAALVTTRASGEVAVFHPSEQTRHPGVAVDGDGNFHLSYLAREKGKDVDDIFHAVSMDGGQTWSAPVDVSGTPGQSSVPVIAGHGRDLVIAWVDTTAGADHPDIWAAVSADAGATWTAAADVSKTPGISSEPAVAVAPDGTVHVVWLDTTDGADHPDIWHTQSSDHGKTWKASENVSKTPGVSSHPGIAAGPGGKVYVDWSDTTNAKEKPDIWYVKSEDGGMTWTKPFDVSQTPGKSLTPAAAVAADGSVSFVWTDTSGNVALPDVFVATAHDDTFERPIDVSMTPGASTEPAITAAEGALVVVWQDTSHHPKTPDIWLSYSIDGGATFSKARDVSNTPGVSAWPRVALVQHIALVVWEEEEKGAFHIRLTRVPISYAGAKGDSAWSK